MTASLLACWAGAAVGQTDACHDPFSTNPPGQPLAGTLRWEVGATAAGLADDWRFAGSMDAGVSKIVDVAYQSFDLGLHASVGVATGSAHAIFEAIEANGRFYPIKLRQAFGIDACGTGTKTRRWSEHTDGVGYIGLRLGFGHVQHDVPSRSTLIITPGVGYEQNLGEGRTTSLFFQVGWRFDAPEAKSSVSLMGPVLEAGLRF